MSDVFDRRKLFITVDVAEATCFALLRMMQTPSPIDSDITLVSA